MRATGGGLELLLTNESQQWWDGTADHQLEATGGGSELPLTNERLVQVRVAANQ